MRSRFHGLRPAVACGLLVSQILAASANAAEVLRREHPYDCPEVLAIDVAGGLDAYLAWLSAGTGG
jgi:uncharacterized protein involved in tolerance to divalent cations